MRRHLKDGGPAFPQLDISATERDGHGDLIEPITVASGGMSLRDWVAGLCIAAAFGDGENEALQTQEGESVADALTRHWEGVAQAAFCAADAFIKVRND